MMHVVCFILSAPYTYIYIHIYIYIHLSSYLTLPPHPTSDVYSFIKGRDGHFYYTDQDKENPNGDGGEGEGVASVV